MSSVFVNNFLLSCASDRDTREAGGIARHHADTPQPVAIKRQKIK